MQDPRDPAELLSAAADGDQRAWDDEWVPDLRECMTPSFRALERDLRAVDALWDKGGCHDLYAKAYDHTFALNRWCDCYACGDQTRPLYLEDIAAGRILARHSPERGGRP